jgi:hypothetical protein
MNNIWFRPLGWIYRLVSCQGWLALLSVAALCVQIFAAIDRHSASDTLYGIFPYFVCAASLLNWVASKTAPQR